MRSLSSDLDKLIYANTSGYRHYGVFLIAYNKYMLTNVCVFAK
jgi:hypothetical protein